MNFKAILVSVIICCVVMNCQSQSYKLNWGEESSKENGAFPNKFIGESNGFIYMLKDKYSSAGIHRYLFLEKYTSDKLQCVASEEITKMKGEFTDIVLINGKLILLSQAGKNTNPLFYATPIDIITLKPAKESVTILNVSLPNAEKNTFYRCGFVLSADSTRLMAFAGSIVNGKLQVSIINGDLTTYADGNIDINLKGSYRLSRFRLSKANNLYCLVEEELPETEWFSKDDVKYKQKLMMFDLKNKTSKVVPVPVKINLPLTRWYLDNNGDMIQLLNYYYKAGTKHAVNEGGILYYQFKASDLTLVNSLEKSLDASAFTHLNANITLPGSNSFDVTTNSINSLKNSEIISLKNGDDIILSEQLIVLEGGTNHGVNYFNILVSRINKNGQLMNQTVIPKRQAGLTKSAYSFVAFANKTAVHILFLDNPKNMNLADPYVLEGGIASVRGTVPAIITIPETGKWTKQPLFNDENLPVIYPNTAFYRKGKELLIYGEKKKKIQFAKFEY